MCRCVFHSETRLEYCHLVARRQRKKRQKLLVDTPCKTVCGWLKAPATESSLAHRTGKITLDIVSRDVHTQSYAANFTLTCNIRTQPTWRKEQRLHNTEATWLGRGPLTPPVVLYISFMSNESFWGRWDISCTPKPPRHEEGRSSNETSFLLLQGAYNLLTHEGWFRFKLTFNFTHQFRVLFWVFETVILC